GDGSDRYEWSKDDGNDTLNDTADSLVETDVLVLTDVASDDVSLTRVHGSSDLKLEIVSTLEVITVTNQFYATSHGDGIEAIEFSDGVTWTLDDIKTKTILYGTSGNDTMHGNTYGDTLHGLAGDDTIYGYDEADILAGGTGADTIYGGIGDDTYEFARGDGSDTIFDQSVTSEDIYENQLVPVTILTGEDQTPTTRYVTKSVYVRTDTTYHEAGRDALSFGAGIALADLQFSTNGDDLIIAILDENGLDVGDQVTLKNWMIEEARVETFEFADGTTLSAISVDASGNLVLGGTDNTDLIIGGAGNDTISGGAGNDIIYGGDGDDVLDAGANVSGGWQYMNGEEGNDTYQIGNDIGRVFIGNNGENATTGTADRVVFTDLALADVTFSTYDYGSSSIHGVALSINWEHGGESHQLRLA
ncbi:MAG: hypothetical protein GY753_04430, partial [Gammaproteobacteria bacterium]|nr:hypothetical protein [Gammaproteobacteria bacterium]